MDNTCGWCGAGLPGGRPRRYCPRPRSCRQQAYRERRRAAAALRAWIALLQISREIRARCEALELMVADSVEQERAAAGLHSAAAADFRHLTGELVRCAVIADREVSATWEQIGRPHGLSADAARSRYSRARLLWPPPMPE